MVGVDVFYTVNINALGTDDGIAATAAIEDVVDVFITISAHSCDEVTTGLLVFAACGNDDVAVYRSDIACGVGERGVSKEQKQKYKKLGL